MFKGSMVALITPMRADGSVDEKAFVELVQWQIAEGTEGLIPVGTTGESPTLSHEEHKRVVELCVEAAAGRVPVIAGTGSNSTSEAIEFTRHAKKAGADACLVVTPYYNKPTQEGLFLHFKAIADAVDLPMVMYNIPGRSVIDMSVETMARLAKHPNIIGVKDATANLVRPLHTRRACGADFAQLSGVREEPLVQIFGIYAWLNSQCGVMLPSVGLWLNASKSESMLAKVDETNLSLLGPFGYFGGRSLLGQAS